LWDPPRRPEGDCRRGAVRAPGRDCSGRARKHARPAQPRPGAGHAAPGRAGRPARTAHAAFTGCRVGLGTRIDRAEAADDLRPRRLLRLTLLAPCEWPARRPLAQAPRVQRRERIRRGPHAAGRRVCFPDACFALHHRVLRTTHKAGRGLLSLRRNITSLCPAAQRMIRVQWTRIVSPLPVVFWSGAVWTCP